MEETLCAKNANIGSIQWRAVNSYTTVLTKLEPFRVVAKTVQTQHSRNRFLYGTTGLVEAAVG